MEREAKGQHGPVDCSGDPVWRPGLISWLKRRGMPRWAAEDMADQAILRSVRKFGWGACTAEAVAWTYRVADNMAKRAWRAAAGAVFVCAVDLDQLRAGRASNGADIPPVAEIVDMMWPDLSRPEQQVATFLLAGIWDNRTIANRLGISVRAVEQTRQKLRSRASDAGNICRLIRWRP